MSNVSAKEVFEITAASFGTTIAAMGKRYQGRYGNTPMPSVARTCAVMLARLHTGETYTRIAAIMNWHLPVHATRIRKAADKFPDRLVSDLVLKLQVQAIEDEIDALHEARVEAMEAAQKSGLAGLALANKPKPAKARRRAEAAA